LSKQLALPHVTLLHQSIDQSISLFDTKSESKKKLNTKVQTKKVHT